jgi:hypothetical protein
MAQESYDPKGGLSFTDFLKNKLRAHTILLHLGSKFSKDEKISMLIQSVVTHQHAIQLMHKIDNEHEKGIDFQLIVNRIIKKDYKQLMFNHHSSQVHGIISNLTRRRNIQ